MCRKVIFLMSVVLVLGLVGSVWAVDNPGRGAYIIIITEDPNGELDTYEPFLEELYGEGVEIEGIAQKYRELDAEKIANLESANLIIVSRNTNSKYYDDGDEPEIWNGLETPLMLHSAFLARSQSGADPRWRWFDSESKLDSYNVYLDVSDVCDPIFDGVTIDDYNQTTILDAGFFDAGHDIDIIDCVSAGYGTLLATAPVLGKDCVAIARWDAGTHFWDDPCRPQTAGGPRIFFAMASSFKEISYLTADGKKLLENAMTELLWYTFDFDLNVAYRPYPKPKAISVPFGVVLHWSPGNYAADANGHDVYFGTDFNDVNSADTTVYDPNNVYMGRQDANSFNTNNYDSNGLAPGQTYYWRIDEVNSTDPNSPWKGRTWSFTTDSGIAKNPCPSNGTQIMDPNIVLSWSPGICAASHNIYFGTDFNEVNNAVCLAGDMDGSGRVGLNDVRVLAEQWLKKPPGGSEPSADLNDDDNVNFIDFAIVADNWLGHGDGVFRGHHTIEAASYAASDLTLGETYYWRIDEVNDLCIWKGDVWSFKVEGWPSFRVFSGVCRHGREPLRSLYDKAIGWGRQDIPWDTLEPYAPNDPEYVWRQDNLDDYGDLVMAYNAEGAHLLPILDYGTNWSGGYRFVDSEHVVDWQNYVERVVTFLSAPPYYVEYFQVWNEPDLSMFWSGDLDTFMTNVHLPAAEVIHNLGCKVVFGGWLGSISSLVDLLDSHNAWDSINVLDTHYSGVFAWPYLRDAAATRGYDDMPIWGTEISGCTYYISNFYPRLFYWTLTHNADVAADMYKVFYYEENTLYYGDNLSYQGISLQTLGDLFDGAIVSAYQDVENDRLLIPQENTGVSSIESFNLGDRVVTAIHLDDGDVVDPATDTITLTYSEFTQPGDVNSIERVDVSGYETDLTGSYDVNGLTVTVPVANDPCSPVQDWGLSGEMYNIFYAVVTRNE